MSNIDISGQAADVYDGQPDSFTSKPVSMVSLIIKKRGRKTEEAFTWGSYRNL